MAEKEGRHDPNPPTPESVDDQYDYNDPIDDEEEEPTTKRSWIRLAIGGSIFVLLIITMFALCGRRTQPVPPPQLMQDTTVTKQVENALPSPVETPTASVEPTVVKKQSTQVNVNGDAVMVFNYVVKNGSPVKESTVALLKNGKVDMLQINEEFVKITNPQTIEDSNGIIALSFGNIMYVTNAEALSTLNLEVKNTPSTRPGCRIRDTYVVQYGDTGDGIRKHFGMRPGELKNLNLGYDLNHIREGQKLIITRNCD